MEQEQIGAIEAAEPVDIVNDAPVMDAPETAPEPAQETPPAPKMVPEEHYENLKKALAETRRESRAKQQQLETAFQQVMQRINAPQQQAPEIDIEAQPIEALKATKAELQQIKQALTQQSEQARIDAQLRSVVTAAEAEFRQEAPDYNDALNFVSAQRQKQYEALGYSPDEAAQAVYSDARQIAITALQRGVSPAHAAYQMALAAGYQRQAPQAQAAQQVQQFAKAGQAAKTLAGGGEAPKGEVTLEALSKLSGAAFDAAFAKMARDGRLG